MTDRAALLVTTEAGLTRRGHPSIATLTLVELRKTVDTRAGFWLLVLTGIVLAGLAIIQSQTASGIDAESASIFQTGSFAAGFILPVVGILLMTSEWSQRTALLTFVLVPRREWVVTAKLMAGFLVALTATAVAAAIGLLVGSLLGEGANLTLKVLGQGALLLMITVSIGISLGLALRSSPLAIVFYFVGPPILAVVGSFSEKIADLTTWLDLSVLTGLANTELTDWDRLTVAVATWIILPLAIGLYRLSHADVD